MPLCYWLDRFLVSSLSNPQCWTIDGPWQLSWSKFQLTQWSANLLGLLFGIDPNNPLKMSVSEKGGSYYPNMAICREFTIIYHNLPFNYRKNPDLTRWIWGYAATTGLPHRHFRKVLEELLVSWCRLVHRDHGDFETWRHGSKWVKRCQEPLYSFGKCW